MDDRLQPGALYRRAGEAVGLIRHGSSGGSKPTELTSSIRGEGVCGRVSGSSVGSGMATESFFKIEGLELICE
jgi:hypothetical protein